MKVRRDGPSLWIREEGKAGRRVPARLVSRVVILGNLRLDTAVLMLFAEHEVPIMFLSPSGEAKACLMPAETASESLKERQRLIAEDDLFLQRAEQWLISMRKSIRLGVLRALAPSLAREYECLGFRDGDYDMALRAFLPCDQRLVAPVSSTIAGLLHELIVRQVVDAGLDPHCGIMHRRMNFGLCKDFLYVLDAEIDRQTVRFFQTKRCSPLNDPSKKPGNVTSWAGRAIIHRFENRRPQVACTIDTLLDGYFRLLRELP